MPNGCIVSEEIVVGQRVVLGCTDSTAINFDLMKTQRFLVNM